ncbi:MAG: hypothetical protein Q4G25_05205 [Paracoccus sp. (in: a-proteobacteria)]|nr:hypothetical protein [Paracoccus sp. (in: a-proteobacteria)]
MMNRLPFSRLTAALILLTLAACAPPPPLPEVVVVSEAPAETVADDDDFHSGEVGGYAQPIMVEAAPIGTAMGETRISSVGRGEYRVRRGRIADAVAVITYGPEKPEGYPMEKLIFLDDRIEIEFLRNGYENMPVYRSGGQYRLQGKVGDRYEIKVKSNSGEDEFLFVVSVDGLNVMNNRPARRWNDYGLFLWPRSSHSFEGFRLNNDEVAAFRFSDPGQSAAVTTGRGSAANVGVIGIAVYEHRNFDRESQNYQAMLCRKGQPCAFPN